MLFDTLAEEAIRLAMERGEFDDLPGAGRPLDLDEAPLVPEELRMAYRVLRNAGYLPPELEARREIHDLRQLLACLPEGPQRSRGQRRLEALRLRLALNGGREVALPPDYAAAVCRRLD